MRLSFHRGLLAGTALLVVLGSTLSARAETPPDVDKLNKKIDPFTLTDAGGKKVGLADFKDKKAVVVVFLSFECPVSTSYSPVLAELHKTYAPRGIAFLGLDASDEGGPAAIAKLAEEYKLP